MEKSRAGLSCNLVEEEFRERKSVALGLLKTQVMDRQEVHDGVVYTFSGTDGILDQLLEFVKAERSCCPFFKFELTIRDVKDPVLLRITGPDGVKEFIRDELDM